MGILEAFDQSEEILTPSKIIKKQEGFPSHVIGVFQSAIIEALLKNYKTEVITTLFAGYPIPIYKVTVDGVDIAVYQTPIGAPATCGLMEELIAKGGTSFLYFGSCGTLDKKIAVGHFILPTKAYREEGMSYHYVAPSEYIDVTTVDTLETIFQKNGIPYVLGRTWTTDAFYRETKNKVVERRKEGCICVEMECAAIMAVARYRGVKAYQYLYAEDTLDGTEWDPRSMGNVEQSSYEAYLDLGLKISTDLS